MTTFVRLSEDDQAYDLVILLNRLDAGITDLKEEKDQNKQASAASMVAADDEEAAEEEQYEDHTEAALEEAKDSKLGKLVSSKKYTQLLDEFFKRVDKMWECEEALADATFSVAMDLMRRTEGAPSKYVDKFTKAIRSNSESSTRLRLQMLTVLYNTLIEDGKLRYKVLCAVLEYAGQTGQARRLADHLPEIDNATADWNLGPKEKLDLSRLVAELYAQASMKDEAQEALFKYLVLDPNADEKYAIRLCITAAKYERRRASRKAYYEYDQVLGIEAVKKLEKSKTGAPAFGLVKLFCEGTIEDFKTYAKANQSFLSEAEGLAEEDLLSVFRTLTICSLGMEKERLSFVELQQKLGLESGDEVEEVVIEAVTTGKLEAKIDQEREEVVILRAAPRSFQKEDWAKMQVKLAKWQGNVERVLAHIQAVNADQSAEEGY